MYTISYTADGVDNTTVRLNGFVEAVGYFNQLRSYYAEWSFQGKLECGSRRVL